MEQHLATDDDGELGKESPAAEEAPALNAQATPQTVETTSVAADQDAAAEQPVTAAPPADEAVSEASAAAAPPHETTEPVTAEVPATEPAPMPAVAEPETGITPPPAAASAPEPAVTPAPKPHDAIPVAPPPPSTAFLEQWQQNERMRHIPAISWIVAKVDGDVRQRLEMFLGVFESLPSADPRHRAAEEALVAACRSLDRLAETARRTRSVLHPPNEIAYRIPWSVNTAVSVLRNTDANTFDRRQPFQSFERSVAECVYGSLVVVLQRIDAAAALMREIDPAVDEKLYGPLVQLAQPLPTAPIA